METNQAYPTQLDNRSRWHFLPQLKPAIFERTASLLVGSVQQALQAHEKLFYGLMGPILNRDSPEPRLNRTSQQMARGAMRQSKSSLHFCYYIQQTALRCTNA